MSGIPLAELPVTAGGCSRIYLEFAEQVCWIASDRAEMLRDIERALPRLLHEPAPDAHFGLGLHFTGLGGLRISAFHHGRPCDLSTMFEGPEWKLFTRIPDERRRLFSNSLFGDEPLIEFIGGDMTVLQEARRDLCALLAFNWLLLRGERLVNLHAAVCALNGQAIILIGPSGAGKSTLAQALRQRGADVYGDEWAYFTLPNYRLYAWERPLCLRPGGVDALGGNRDAISWHEAKPGDPKWSVPFTPPKEPCPRDRAHLFFIDGFGEKPTIRPIRGGEAARRLVQGIAYGRADLMVRLEIASDLVNRYPCSLLTIGRPSETGAAIEAILGRENP